MSLFEQYINIWLLRSQCQLKKKKQIQYNLTDTKDNVNHMKVKIDVSTIEIYNLKSKIYSVAVE